MIKSVLHIRLDAPSYSSNGIMDGFKEQGFEYFYLSWQDYRFNTSVDALQVKILEMAVQHKPSIIFLHIQNSEIINPEFVKKLQEISCVINYTFDVRSKENSQWLYNIAPSIGLTLFACKEDVDYCKSIGVYNVALLQSTIDIKLYKDGTNEAFPLYSPKIAFIGNNYVNTNLNFDLANERLEMVNFLKKEYPDDFKEYGMNWSYSQIVNSQKEVSIYNSSLISINQSNYDRELYTSDRLWRIMACGTFCLSKHFVGIEKMFKRGVHLDWFHNLEELKSKIDYYLHNDSERNGIAKEGMEFVRENHNWSCRVKEIEKLVKELS